MLKTKQKENLKHSQVNNTGEEQFNWMLTSHSAETEKKKKITLSTHIPYQQEQTFSMNARKLF
jgi:hypothetical protein